ncbi:MAG: ATP-binding protein, partial [Heliobacteriaceae bacterium]|nr:ATP-binding protein [Heliobacteriaceae bacterium]
MNKKNVLDLIRYYAENNDDAFRTESYEIARYFDKIGDYQLAEYIMALLSNTNTFVPQITEAESKFFKRIEYSSDSLPLPEVIKKDILGIVNAVGHNAGVNKFLFEGAPGTGKTETAKQVARILERELFIVEFSAIVDSKLGQTSKNIAALFEDINHLPHPNKIIILFDEIDALAIDRINSNDLREMGRATSAILKGIDSLNNNIVLIATTNLFSAFDKALIRRFDAVINFNRYSREDLMEISEI